MWWKFLVEKLEKLVRSLKASNKPKGKIGPEIQELPGLEVPPFESRKDKKPV